MTWKNRRVLVTGAGGFIGSHLAEALAAVGADVLALVQYNSRNGWGHLEPLSQKPSKNIDVVSGDVRDPSFVHGIVAKREVVFHLAALIPIPYSYVAPHSFVETNVLGTLNVLEACRRAGVKRLVHTSTSEVYGSAQYVPIDEKHPLRAQSPYAASKIAADQLVLSFHRSFGLPAVVVRPFNTFGPRQSARAVIPTVLSAFLSGQTPSLGATWPVRDFTYVDDTVAGFMKAAERAPLGETVNLGTGRGWSVRQVVDLCARIAGRPAAVRRDAQRVRPAGSEVDRLVSDAGRARRLMGWAARVPFEEGLQRTADYVRAHLSDYKTRRYNT